MCICLAEMHGSVLKELTESQWVGLKKMLPSASGVLWVTQGGAMNVTSAEAGLISGLARTARSENAAPRLLTLDMDPEHVCPDEKARILMSVLDRASVSKDVGEPTADLEFIERAGQTYIPRVVVDESLQKHLTAGTTEPDTEVLTFIQPTRPLSLEVVAPGLLDSLRASPAANEWKLQPKCYGVNFRDVTIALGQLEDSSLMSSEHSGIVTEVGIDLRDSFQVGDRICAWGGKAYASSVTVNGLAAQSIPDDRVSRRRLPSLCLGYCILRPYTPR